MSSLGKSGLLEQLTRRLASDSEFREKFLPNLEQSETSVLQTRLGPNAREASNWCTQWTIFDPSTVVPITAVNLVQFPSLSDGAVLARTRHCLWVYALDDLMDGPAQVDETLRECYLSAYGAGLDSHVSELSRSLGQIRAELARFPGFSSLYPIWLVSFEKMLSGMVYERWMQTRRLRAEWSFVLPAYDEYMHYAVDSIAIPHLWITGLVLEQDESIPEALWSLCALVKQCAVVVRLANDLASYRREEQEGVVNAVAVIREELRERDKADENECTARALTVVGERLTQSRADLREMARQIRTRTRIEHRYVRAAELSADLYAAGDVRDWRTGAGVALEAAPGV